MSIRSNWLKLLRIPALYLNVVPCPIYMYVTFFIKAKLDQ